MAETVSATGERRGDSGGHRLSGAIHCRESEEKEGLRDRGREGGRLCMGTSLETSARKRGRKKAGGRRGRVGGQTLKSNGRQQNLLCCSFIFCSLMLECHVNLLLLLRLTYCLILFPCLFTHGEGWKRKTVGKEGNSNCTGLRLGVTE